MPSANKHKAVYNLTAALFIGCLRPAGQMFTARSSVAKDNWGQMIDWQLPRLMGPAPSWSPAALSRSWPDSSQNESFFFFFFKSRRSLSDLTLNTFCVNKRQRRLKKTKKKTHDVTPAAATPPSRHSSGSLPSSRRFIFSSPAAALPLPSLAHFSLFMRRFCLAGAQFRSVPLKLAFFFCGCQHA